MRRPFGTFIQTAYLVRDLDAAIEYWTRVMGAGPFFVGDFEPHDQVWRGQRTGAHLTTALGGFKDMHIELVRQNNDAPSAFNDGRHRPATVIHHLHAVEEDYDVALARYAAGGCELAQTSRHPVIGRIAMIDALDTMGAYIEVVDLTPTCLAINEAIWKAHDGWDGSDPRRDFHALF